MLSKHPTVYIFILPFWLLFTMIILFFILFSCYPTKKINFNSSQKEKVFFFTLGSDPEWERLISGHQGTQELAQLYWLRGVQRYGVEDLIKARALGCTCLQEDKTFSLSQISETDLNWVSFDWTQRGSCRMDMASEVMPLPKDLKHVACVTWTILSWSKLLQYYQMDKEVLDAKRMLYLSTWLFEQERCLESPWVSFAIATGFMNSVGDGSDPIGRQKRKDHALKIIGSLWDHEEIGSLVRLWYITFRTQEGEYTKKERAAWLHNLQRIKSNSVQREEAAEIEAILLSK